jgi:hypothetical protein
MEQFVEAKFIIWDIGHLKVRTVRSRNGAILESNGITFLEHGRAQTYTR